MRPSSGDGLLHPIALGAIAVLVLNDHVLKGAAPGLVTGKLSDVAGLVFFPLFLQAALELLGAPVSRRVLRGAVIATAAVFAAVQVLPWATDAYRWGLGAIQWAVTTLGTEPLRPVAATPDPWDLATLPALAVAWGIGRGRGAPEGAVSRPRPRASWRRTRSARPGRTPPRSRPA